MGTRGSVRGSGGNHDGYKQRTHQDETKQPRPRCLAIYRRPPLQYVCVRTTPAHCPRLRARTDES